MHIGPNDSTANGTIMWLWFVLDPCILRFYHQKHTRCQCKRELMYLHMSNPSLAGTSADEKVFFRILLNSRYLPNLPALRQHDSRQKIKTHKNAVMRNANIITITQRQRFWMSLSNVSMILDGKTFKKYYYCLDVDIVLFLLHMNNTSKDHTYHPGVAEGMETA